MAACPPASPRARPNPSTSEARPRPTCPPLSRRPRPPARRWPTRSTRRSLLSRTRNCLLTKCQANRYPRSHNSLRESQPKSSAPLPSLFACPNTKAAPGADRTNAARIGRNEKLPGTRLPDLSPHKMSPLFHRLGSFSLASFLRNKEARTHTTHTHTALGLVFILSTTGSLGVQERLWEWAPFSPILDRPLSTVCVSSGSHAQLAAHRPQKSPFYVAYLRHGQTAPQHNSIVLSYTVLQLDLWNESPRRKVMIKLFLAEMYWCDAANVRTKSWKVVWTPENRTLVVDWTPSDNLCATRTPCGAASRDLRGSWSCALCLTHVTSCHNQRL